QRRFVRRRRVFRIWPGRSLFTSLAAKAVAPVFRSGHLMAWTGVHRRCRLGFSWARTPDPSTPEWGAMLTDAASLIRVAPHLVFFPGLAIVVVVMGLNLLGDGIREALDPRVRR